MFAREGNTASLSIALLFLRQQSPSLVGLLVGPGSPQGLDADKLASSHFELALWSSVSFSRLAEQQEPDSLRRLLVEPSWLVFIYTLRSEWPSTIKISDRYQL
jgi:hypothetical protein